MIEFRESAIMLATTTRRYNMIRAMAVVFMASLSILRARTKGPVLDGVESHAPKEDAVELNDFSRCMISSQGVDGIGHQTEAKFSCIASAIFLNMTYIHIPFNKSVGHGIKEKELLRLEDFLGLSNFFPVFNSENMTIGPREPLPDVYKCQERNWFENSIHKDCTSDTTVYTGDNCWDHFWCHITDHIDEWNHQVKPLLRRAYFSSPKPILPEFDVADINIAVHVRRGDSPVEFWIPLQDIGLILAKIWLMQPLAPNRSVHFHVHTDDIYPGDIREGLFQLFHFDDDDDEKGSDSGDSDDGFQMERVRQVPA